MYSTWSDCILLLLYSPQSLFTFLHSLSYSSNGWKVRRISLLNIYWLICAVSVSTLLNFSRVKASLDVCCWKWKDFYSLRVIFAPQWCPPVSVSHVNQSIVLMVSTRYLHGHRRLDMNQPPPWRKVNVGWVVSSIPFFFVTTQSSWPQSGVGKED